MRKMLHIPVMEDKVLQSSRAAEAPCRLSKLDANTPHKRGRKASLTPKQVKRDFSELLAMPDVAPAAAEPASERCVAIREEEEGGCRIERNGSARVRHARREHLAEEERDLLRQHDDQKEKAESADGAFCPAATVA